LKLDARESAQEVMKMEEIITDLNETNEKLAKELELTRGQ
jgi:hypothetical protein